MLTDEQLKKIQEAMKDTEFAKSVMETKTEEEIVSLLKDKKGITVSVDDIKDLNETVRKIPTEELNVAGGEMPKWLSDFGSGLKAGTFIDGWDTFRSSVSGTDGVPKAVGAVTPAVLALVAVSALGYKVYKKYYGSKSDKEAVTTPTADSVTAKN